MQPPPRLLDLFCGAGGAAMGYQRAGFEVVGVDIRPQPNYPFEFVQGDALARLGEIVHYGWRSFDAIHASPPCQAFTAYRRKGHGVGDGYQDLIAPTRELLRATGLPYIIENVPGAPLSGVVLCGSSFGLDVRRHRVFETNFIFDAPACDHSAQKAKGKRFPGATNRNGRFTCEIGVWRIPLDTQKAAMGWAYRECSMDIHELSESLPPAYTEYIGKQLIQHLGVK